MAWAAGVRYFDTAHHYGLGLSVRRLGEALRDHPRDEYVVSTKVGRLLEENPAYSFRTMRPRFLKNIGRVSLSVLRHAEDAPSTIREAIEERRRGMRELVRERLALRSSDDSDDDVD